MSWLDEVHCQGGNTPFRSSLVRSSIPFLFLVLATAITVARQSTHNQKVSSPNNSRNAKTSEVRAVLVQAKSAALKIRNGYQRGLVLDEIGAAEAKAGLLHTAVVTANRSDSQTMAILKAIGEELGNSNDLPKAQALGLRLKADSPSSIFETGVTLADSLRSAGLCGLICFFQ